MKHGTRLASSVCLATSVVLCLTALFYSSAHAISPAHATRETVTGSIVSSPSSGPVGATNAIRGSGWPDPDGEQVSFGYMIASYCSTVPDSQAGTLHGGSFSGWLRWPNGTPLGIYTVCATLGSTTAPANTYKVLSGSAPQVSISPSILTAGTQATVTGSNYYPAGTSVQLFWETLNGSVNIGITPAISNSNGLISRTFVVPTTTLASGSYKIVAIVGGGQPPTLSSSTTFTYNAPVPAPSPTPSPRPDPTPTQQLSPTATATAVASPIITPTIGSTATTGSPNTNTGQTPTSSTTTNTTTTNQPTSILLIVGGIGFLTLLTAILIIVLLIRRKKARSMRMMGEIGSPTNGLLTWQNGQVGNSAPGNMPYGSNTPIPPWTVPTANGGSMSPPPLGKQSTPLSQQQLQVSPYVHLLQQPNGGSTGLVHDHSTMAPNDPNFEAIKRQVQMGLFAIPGQRRDEGSS
jgi:hypothetical protein